MKTSCFFRVPVSEEPSFQMCFGITFTLSPQRQMEKHSFISIGKGYTKWSLCQKKRKMEKKRTLQHWTGEMGLMIQYADSKEDPAHVTKYNAILFFFFPPSFTELQPQQQLHFPFDPTVRGYHWTVGKGEKTRDPLPERSLTLQFLSSGVVSSNSSPSLKLISVFLKVL